MVDGYIEEIMDGQKVVKVFCHEAQALEGFRQRNRKLFDRADKANAFGNITMPVNANLGNISFTSSAPVVGALFALGGATSPDFGHPGLLPHPEQERHPAPSSRSASR